MKKLNSMSDVPDFAIAGEGKAAERYTRTQYLVLSI
jgi:hypothetical protein